MRGHFGGIKLHKGHPGSFQRFYTGQNFIGSYRELMTSSKFINPKKNGPSDKVIEDFDFAVIVLLVTHDNASALQCQT